MKEKKSKKKVIIISVIAAALILGAGIPLAVSLLKDKSEKIEEINDNQTQIMARPTDGTLPKDHSVLDNIKIAAGVIHDNPHFRTVSEGHALTTMVIQNDQFVHTERFVDGQDNSMTNYYTYSSFKTEAFQRYFTSDRVCIRKGDVDKKTNVVTYNPGDPNVYSLDYARQEIGWFPYQMTSYIFSEETILEAEVIENPKYDYYVKLVMDTEISISQTKREVRLNGGAISYPTYDKVEVWIGMDNNWVVREIHNEETYWLDVKMGVTLHAPADTNMTEYFYYDNYKISDETIAYYSKYSDVSIDKPSIEQKEKTPTDYLMDSMLGLVLEGGSLDINGFVGDYETTGKLFVKFDINSMDANVIGLFDDLYFKYDGNMKLSYRKHNYSWDSSFFNYVIDSLNVDLDTIIDSVTSGDSLGETQVSDNGLLSQLSDIKMDVKENSDNTKDITLSGEMKDGDTSLEYTILVLEDEYGSLLKGIDVNARTLDNDIKLNITPSINDNFNFVEPEYVDLSSTTWVVDEMINLSSYEGYNFDMNYDYSSYKVKMNAKLDKFNKAYVTTTIDKIDSNKEPVNIDLYYLDEEVYFLIGGIKVKATSNDINDIISEISLLVSSYFEEDEFDPNVVDTDLSTILNTTYEVFDGINVNDNSDIIMSIALSTLFNDVNDGQVVLSKDEDGLLINVNPYNFVMKVYENKDLVNVNPNEDYLTRKEFDSLVYYALSLYDMTKEDVVKISFTNTNIKVNDYDYLINGYIAKDNENYEANISLSGEYNINLKLVYLDEYYYLNVKYDDKDINVKCSNEELLTLIKDIETGSYTLIEEYKIREYVDALILKYQDILFNNEVSVDEVLDYIYLGLVESDNIDIKFIDDTITLIYKEDYKIELDKNNDGFNFILDKVSYEGVNISGSLGISNSFELSNIETNDYINIDKVLTAIDQIVVELDSSNITIEDIKEMVNDVSSYNGYNIVINTTYENYQLLFNINVTKDYKINGTISLIKDDKEPISFDLYYLEDSLYIEYGNIAVVIDENDKEDIISLLNEYSLISDNENELLDKDVQDIIDLIFDVYRGIKISEDNKVDITLLLSKVNDNVKDITLRLYYIDNNIHIDVPEYLTFIKVSSYEENEDDFNLTKEYLTKEDLDSFISCIKEVKDVILNKEYSLDINNVSISLNEVNYVINGKLIINNDDLSINLNVLYNDKDINIKLIKLENTYYLSSNASEDIKISLSEENILKLISDAYKNKEGLILNSELDSLFTYISDSLGIDLTKTYTIEEIIDIAYPYVISIKDGNINVNNNKFEVIYLENTASLIKDESIYKVEVNANINDIKLDMNISLNNKKEDIILDEANYINIDKVITILNNSLNEISLSKYSLYDLYNIALDIVSFKDYNIDLTYTYEDYVINVNATLLNNLNTKAHINISKVNEEPIDLDLIYINDNIYLTIKENSVVISKDDINDIISLISPSLNDKTIESNVTYNEILNKVTHILSSFTIDNDGNFHIGLLLDEVIEVLDKEIIIDLSYDQENKLLRVSNNDYNVIINVTKANEEVKIDETKIYLSRNDFDNIYSKVNEVISLINSNNFETNINNLKVTIDDKEYNLNLKLIVKDNIYYLDADLTGEININISLYLLEENYYVSFKYDNNEPIELKLHKEAVLGIIKKIIDNKDIFLGELTLEEYINKYIGEIPSIEESSSKDINILDIYKGFIDISNTKINVNGTDISLIHDDFSVSFISKDDTNSLNIAINDINNVSIMGEISLSTIKDEPIINETKYYDATRIEETIIEIVDTIILNKWSIEDAVNMINEILDYDGYLITIDQIRVEKIIVSGTIKLDSEMNAELDLHIAYENKSTDIKVYRLGNDLFVRWDSYDFFINEEDLAEVISSISGDSESVTSIYDTIDMIMDLFSNINGENNAFNVSLALSKLYKEIEDSDVSISYNQGIYISSNKNNLNLNVTNLNDKVVNPNIKKENCFSRKDLDVILDYVNGVMSYLKDGMCSLTIDKNNPLNIKLGSMNLIVNGHINFKMVDDGSSEKKVTFSAEVFITGSMHYYFALQYNLQEELYISFSVDWDEENLIPLTPMTLKITRTDIIEVLKVVLDNIDEDSEIGKTMDNFDTLNEIKQLIVSSGLIEKDEMKPEKVEQTIGDIAPMVFSVLDYLKGSSFKINEDKSLHLEKDYVIKTEDEDIITSTNIDVLQVQNNENIDYVFTISKLDLGSISINGGFTISRFEDDVNFEITNAIDLHGLDLLGDALFNSINNMKFYITGELKMTLLGLYTVDVPMDARVKYVDGEIRGYIHLRVPHVIIATQSDVRADSYIYFTKDTIYMRKDSVNKQGGFLGIGAKEVTTTTFRQNTNDEFLANIVDNVVYLFDFTDTIAKAFESDTKFNITEDKLLKSYTYNQAKSTFAFDFDLRNGLGSTMFNEDLILTIGTGVYEDNAYLKSFDGSIKLFSVIALKFNFEEKACFGNEVVFDDNLITTLLNQSM